MVKNKWYGQVQILNRVAENLLLEILSFANHFSSTIGLYNYQKEGKISWNKKNFKNSLQTNLVR